MSLTQRILFIVGAVLVLGLFNGNSANAQEPKTVDHVNKWEAMMVALSYGNVTVEVTRVYEGDDGVVLFSKGYYNSDSAFVDANRGPYPNYDSASTPVGIYVGFTGLRGNQYGHILARYYIPSEAFDRAPRTLTGLYWAGRISGTQLD